MIKCFIYQIRSVPIIAQAMAIVIPVQECVRVTLDIVEIIVQVGKDFYNMIFIQPASGLLDYFNYCAYSIDIIFQQNCQGIL